MIKRIKVEEILKKRNNESNCINMYKKCNFSNMDDESDKHIFFILFHYYQSFVTKQYQYFFIFILYSSFYFFAPLSGILDKKLGPQKVIIKIIKQIF